MLCGCSENRSQAARDSDKDIIIVVEPKYLGCNGDEVLPKPLYVNELGRIFLGTVLSFYATDQKLFHKYPNRNFSGTATIAYTEPPETSENDIVFSLRPEYHCQAQRPYVLLNWNLVSAPDLDLSYYTSDNVYSARSDELRRLYFDFDIDEQAYRRSVQSLSFLARPEDRGIRLKPQRG